MKSIAVYCGANPGTDPVYADAARELGRLLAKRGIGVVFGGGHVGLMGVVADAALEAGGRVTGVIPQQLVDRELAHSGLTELFVVRNMHERKAMMAELSDGFVALPGGMGTLEELFEMLTWSQLEIHAKPIGVLNVAGFYDQLALFIAHAASQGFIRPQHRDLMMVERDPEALLARLITTA